MTIGNNVFKTLVIMLKLDCKFQDFISQSFKDIVATKSLLSNTR